MKPVLIYITTASEAEAKEIARSLLEAHLIAAANIIPGAVSLFRWQGEDEEMAGATAGVQRGELGEVVGPLLVGSGGGRPGVVFLDEA